MDAEDTQHDPLRDAREAALRRIGELRQRSVGASEPAGPDLRTLLARSERTSTSCGARRASSPPSCRRASRPPSRARSARTRAASADASITSSIRRARSRAAVERVESDLLAERMARVEDLEVLVDLVSGGLTSLRADLRAVRRELAELQAVVGRPLQVTVAREQAEQAAGRPTDAGRRRCACAPASKTRPRARAHVRPDAS